MTINQTTFLGASVSSFNANMGWGQSPSSLHVSLVEDDQNGDQFNPPIMGAPVYFEFNGWEHGGILQNWRRLRNSGANPTYEVIVGDPRELLDGVQLIISGYSGTVNMDNLYNIYGALESQAFGSARVNRNGIEWYQIRDTFNTLQNTTPISFRGYQYVVNLGQLPSLPDYYRIGGEVISLMNFITEVCEAASYDFFFSLRQSNGINYITLNTISRQSQPALGYISQYVNSSDSIIANESGFELRNEITSKFLVGGNVTDIYFQYDVQNEDNPEENTIWYYWGLNLNQNPVIGEGEGNDHEFELTSTHVNVNGVGDTYISTIEELRSAAVDQASWESFLYMKNNDPGPYQDRAESLGIVSDTKRDISTWLDGLPLEKMRALSPIDFAGFDGKNAKRATDSVSDHEENITRMYNYVRNFASEYYGRRFMVRIPTVQSKYDEDTEQLQTSLEPADGGFIDESTWPNAISLNMLPEFVNLVTTEDGRITCYAKFDDYQNLDLSELSEDDFTISKNSVFVRATVYPQLIFLDRTTLTSPRAIIELPGAVRSKVDDERKSNLGKLKRLLVEKFTDKNSTTPEEDVKEIFARMGGESIMYGEEGLAKIPTMVAIPLKSNVDFYGPWTAVGVPGKVDFEKDDTLVPWNFGGFTVMNLAANARVSEVATNLQVAEGGTIEVPGAPVVLLGGQLIANGPYVTDINVNIGSNGITTTYRLQTWTSRFGKLSKTFIDRQQKVAVDQQRNRRLLRQVAELQTRTLDRKSKIGKPKDFKPPRRKQGHSSSQVLLADVVIDDSNEFGKVNVVAAPNYNVISHIDNNFENKAAASFDHVFSPFSTSVTPSGNIPHYQTPYNGNSSFVNRQLNPFNSYTDIPNYNFTLRGEELVDGDLNDIESDSIRSIGLKLPAIGVGWGLNTAGYVVPSGGNYEAISGIRNKPDQFMAGSIDFRWDEAGKKWACGSYVLLGQVASNIAYRSSGQVNLYSWTPSGVQWNPRHTVWVKDHCLPSGTVAYAGRNCTFVETTGDYYLLTVEPAC